MFGEILHRRISRKNDRAISGRLRPSAAEMKTLQDTTRGSRPWARMARNASVARESFFPRAQTEKSTSRAGTAPPSGRAAVRRAVRRTWWRRSGKAWCGMEGSREARRAEERRGRREWRRSAKGSGGGGDGRREARRRKREREAAVVVGGGGAVERWARRAVTKRRSSPASGGRVKCGSGSARGGGGGIGDGDGPEARRGEGSRGRSPSPAARWGGRRATRRRVGNLTKSVGALESTSVITLFLFF
uniref:Uncharacterized protein n=1 Tax=Oryza nivara TaxID=4536 RepID=A0A0E0IR45_ORYNI